PLSGSGDEPRVVVAVAHGDLHPVDRHRMRSTAAEARGREDANHDQGERDRARGPSPPHPPLPFGSTSRSSSPMYAAMTAGSERTSSGGRRLITLLSLRTYTVSQSRMISLRSCCATRIPHSSSHRICSI